VDGSVDRAAILLLSQSKKIETFSFQYECVHGRGQGDSTRIQPSGRRALILTFHPVTLLGRIVCHGQGGSLRRLSLHTQPHDASTTHQTGQDKTGSSNDDDDDDDDHENEEEGEDAQEEEYAMSDSDVADDDAAADADDADSVSVGSRIQMVWLCLPDIRFHQAQC